MVTAVAGQSEETAQVTRPPSVVHVTAPPVTPTPESVVTISISGESVRVATVPDTDFRPLDLETANEYRAVLNVLSETTQLTQRLADRLMDPLDGKVTEGCRALIAHQHEAPPRFVESLRGYLYGVLTAGGTLDPTTGAVFIPPVPHATFAAAIAEMPSFQTASFDTASWVNHLYDARPNIGQGYYRFKSPADWERFVEQAVERSPESRAALSRVSEIFLRATESGTLSPTDHAEYIRLSQHLLAAQAATLETIVEKVPGAFDPHTRVTIELRPGLAPDITVTPYHIEFKPELTRISGNLLTAENLLPAEATSLRETLKSQERWCLTPCSNPGWGEPSERWIQGGPESSVIDVQFNCAETVSLLGDKRIFQLIVTQPLSARELAALDIEPPSTSFSAGYGAPQTNTPFVRLLHNAGVANYPVSSREETIEPIYSPETAGIDPTHSVESQRQPVLVNVVPLGITSDTASIREISPSLVDDLARASIIADALKTANRTDSATQYILGIPGELTAHGYAIAGAVGNAAACRSEMIQPVLNVLVGYDALVCLRSGALGSLERSTLGIVQELERRGAITLDVSSGGLRITHVDPIKLREIAAILQHQLQLWQMGLPRSAHEAVKELQDSPIIEHSLAPEGLLYARKLDQVTRRRLREEARGEVEAFFAPEALSPLIEKLTPLLGTIPAERLVAAPPGDEAIDTLIRGISAPSVDE